MEQLRTGRSCRRQVYHYESYRMTGREWLLYGGEGIAAAAVIAYVFYRSMVVFFLILPMGLLCPLLKRRELKRRRLQKLNLEFKEGILILSSFLGAGYSVENAFSACVKELEGIYGKEGMITGEFGRIESQIRMNRSPEEALMEFAGRSGLDDVKNFAEVFSAAKRSGGELVSIIAHTAEIIRDKLLVQEEIITMTAAKQFEQKIMNLIPVFIVIYIDATSPGFFTMMYETGVGRLLMTICLTVYSAAFVMAKRIMEIEI